MERGVVLLEVFCVVWEGKNTYDGRIEAFINFEIICTKAHKLNCFQYLLFKLI